MNDKSDVQLLRDYAERHDEAAFGEIVTRHTDFVYSAALRQVESADLAADIAQNVFVDLVRKAKPVCERLTTESSLAGWLHRATRYAALNHLRDTHRQRTNERQAMEQLLTNSESAVSWEQIRPALDEALDSLDDEDREAVLLRYFKNQDFHAVGRTLGVSDDAAQKRVSRAVERLREFFSKRNVTIGAGGLAVLISANAVQSAPIGLAATISAAALAGTVVSTSTAIATTKVITMTALQKTVIGAAFAAAVGTGIFEAHQASQLRSQVQTLQQQQTPLAEEIRQLQRERDDATNQLTGLLAENAQLQSDQKESELLKLRGEVALLNNELQELGKNAKRSDNGLESEDKAWLERVRLLKQRMAQTPAAQIPELQYLTEDDWLRAAKHKLETDDDYRAALSDLDANAEGNFLRVVETALRKYLDAHQGQFPADLSQLKSYFTNAPADDLLQRYQIVPANSVPPANLAGDVGDYVITPKYPINHALWILSPNGLTATSDSNSEIMKVLAPAIRALFAATPMIDGRRDVNLHQLPPYLTTPEQKAAYRKLFPTANTNAIQQ